MSSSLRLTIPEILSLLGLAQCVYLLVYMAFRAGNWRAALLPFCYFLALGFAFFFDFAGAYLGAAFRFSPVASWGAWFIGPPLAVLLIRQIAGLPRPPSWLVIAILLPVPLAALTAWSLSQLNATCRDGITFCPAFGQWLIVLGLAANLFSISALWPQRAVLQNHKGVGASRDRYWLILTLIFVNLFFLILMLFSLTPVLDVERVTLSRDLLGLTLIYLTGSSLFRIYPQTIQLLERKKTVSMSATEQETAKRVEDLLSLDKIYQEAAYTRADLARELNMPEGAVSRIINIHFGKTFPQLLNDRRVADARQLLTDTNLPVKDIAEQVGFNSMASFNRVFRELTGTTPSAHRNNKSEE